MNTQKPDSSQRTINIRERFSLIVQILIGRLFNPLVCFLVGHMAHNHLKYTLNNIKETRQFYAKISRENRPLIICPNHLTMIDSFILAIAFGTPLFFAIHFRRMPWNIPAKENFGSSLSRRIITYIAKCIQLDRHGSPEHIDSVMARVIHLIRKNHPFLIFPEGERSRTGKVDLENIKYGVGRILEDVPNARVLCVYLRGRNQKSYGERPVTGEIFDVYIQEVEPQSSKKGMRYHREVSRQIGQTLVDLETAHFEKHPELEPKLQGV